MKVKSICMSLLMSLACVGIQAEDKNVLPLIPKPSSVEYLGKSLSVNSLKGILVDQRAQASASYLQDALNELVGRKLPIKKGPVKGKTGFVVLRCGSQKDSEAYELKVTQSGVEIRGEGPRGVFYGVTTFMQVMLNEQGALQTDIPTLHIKDAPRFGYRGLMLDPARHFIPADAVKRFIATMAAYKFNVLHFHLSDDQGWRIELKSHPKLHEYSSHYNKPEGTRGYYTQKELKDIVAFAARHQVEVVPEIDMPGHSMGVVTVYPELTCRSVQEMNQPGHEETLKKHPKMKIRLWDTPGVSEALLCASNPKVYKVYSEILGEVCRLFPSPKFHVGGDEAPMDCWKSCPDCQALMKQKQLPKVQDLMSFFFAEMNKILKKYGKQPHYWYELDVPKYPENAVAYAWRMGLSQAAIDRAQKDGFDIICAPGEHAYFDYPNIAGGHPQPNWGMPTTTLERAYQFDPGYGRKAEDQAHILGVEGTLWGECLKSEERLYHMAYPRSFALVEAGWSAMAVRNWEDFTKRVKPHLLKMYKAGLDPYWPKEIYGEKK